MHLYSRTQRWWVYLVHLCRSRRIIYTTTDGEFPATDASDLHFKNKTKFREPGFAVILSADGTPVYALFLY